MASYAAAGLAAGLARGADRFGRVLMSLAEQRRQQQQLARQNALIDLQLADRGYHRGTAPPGMAGATQVTPEFYRVEAETPEARQRARLAPLAESLPEPMRDVGRAVLEADPGSFGTFAANVLKPQQPAGFTFEGMQGLTFPQLVALKKAEIEAGVRADPNKPPAAMIVPPSWSTVATDQGFVQVDPRTGATRPLVGPDGKPLTRTPRIPASVARAVTSNRKQIAVIDSAISALEANPSAVGAKGLLPEFLLQRLDPEGVSVRAAISDIGSLIIHDRTGAVMTAAEAQRLRPFIPSSWDTPEAAKTKLKRLKEIIENDTQALEQQWQALAPGASLGVPAASGNVDAMIDQLRREGYVR